MDQKESEQFLHNHILLVKVLRHKEKYLTRIMIHEDYRNFYKAQLGVGRNFLPK
jgi:hypothetical protein